MEEMKSDKIVYYYDWKDLIIITRTASGKWYYSYTASELMQYINKGRKKEGKRPYGMNISDSFRVGMSLGYRVNSLLRLCQISYGDAPEEDEFKLR